MDEKIFDYVGTPVVVGSRLAVAFTQGSSSAEIRVGTVVGFGYQKSDYTYPNQRLQLHVLWDGSSKGYKGMGGKTTKIFADVKKYVVIPSNG